MPNDASVTCLKLNKKSEASVTILVARMIAIDHIDVRSRDEETRNKQGHAQG